MHFPEDVEQLLVAHLAWIKRHLHDFRVPRLIRANILVGRVRQLTTAIPHRRIDHSRHLLKSRFNSPEAARSKRCNLWHRHLLSELVFVRYYGQSLVRTAIGCGLSPTSFGEFLKQILAPRLPNISSFRLTSFS